MPPAIAVQRERGADPSVALPDYATAGAAGADLRANLPKELRACGILLAPGERALIPTGLRVAVPDGLEMQVRARSGLALRHGVTLANAVGTIDSDYRGPLGVILINLGTEAFTVAHGERIAQAVIAPVARVRFQESNHLDETERADGGFGSTGRS